MLKTGWREVEERELMTKQSRRVGLEEKEGMTGKWRRAKNMKLEWFGLGKVGGWEAR